MPVRLRASQKQALCNYLDEELGYSPKMMKQAVKAVKEMEPDIREMLFSFLSDKEFPAKEIEGVTAQDLVKEAGMNPVTAFLALDYLVKDPEAAKYILSRKPERMELDEEEMEVLYQELKTEPEIN